MVDRRVHRGRRPGVRRADPAHGRRRAGRCDPRARRRLRGRADHPARRRPGRRRRRHRPRPDVEPDLGRRRAGSATGFVRAGADGLPFADASFDAVVACLVFEHIDAVDEAIAEVWPGSSNPAAGSASSSTTRCCRRRAAGWIDDQVLDPPEQYSAHRPVPARGGDDRGGRARRPHPLRAPAAARYVNALADHGLLLERMIEPAPPPGFLALAAEYGEAATVPRLLYLRTRRLAGG